MCIAIGKPMGVELPSKSILQNCWYNNDDGAGFAFAFGGNVYTKKGFMTFEAFMSALDTCNEKYNLKDCGVLLHFRIATHGARDSSMTHPFPLHGDDGALKKIEYISDYAVIHNGIISLTSVEAGRSKGLSDTAIFIQKYLTKIATNRNWFKNTSNMELIEDLIDSKMAILHKSGEIKFTRGFTADHGVFYSNSSYDDNYVKKTYGYTRTSTKYGSGWCYDDYYGKSWPDKTQSAPPKVTNTTYPTNVTCNKQYPLMQVDIGDTLEGDCFSFVIQRKEEAVFYVSEPNAAGLYGVFERYSTNDSLYDDDVAEYFSDYEYIGSGVVYDSMARPKPWRKTTSVYADCFVGDITPDMCKDFTSTDGAETV